MASSTHDMRDNRSRSSPTSNKAVGGADHHGGEERDSVLDRLWQRGSSTTIDSVRSTLNDAEAAAADYADTFSEFGFYVPGGEYDAMSAATRSTHGAPRMHTYNAHGSIHRRGDHRNLSMSTSTLNSTATHVESTASGTLKHRSDSQHSIRLVQKVDVPADEAELPVLEPASARRMSFCVPNVPSDALSAVSQSVYSSRSVSPPPPPVPPKDYPQSQSQSPGPAPGAGVETLPVTASRPALHPSSPLSQSQSSKEDCGPTTAGVFEQAVADGLINPWKLENGHKYSIHINCRMVLDLRPGVQADSEPLQVTEMDRQVTVTPERRTLQTLVQNLVRRRAE